MSKSEKKQVIVTLVVLFLVLAIATGYLTYLSNKTANADELLNFNQLLDSSLVRTDYYSLQFSTNSNGLTTVSGTSTQSWHNTHNGIYTSNDLVPYNKNHIYFLNMNYKYISGDSTNFSLWTNNNATVVEYTTIEGNILEGLAIFKLGTQDYNAFNVFYNQPARSTMHFTIQPILIDLTQMYGSGNEPTLDQCVSYFTTYYAYTSSTLISKDYLNAFNNGVNSVYDSMQATIVASNSYYTLVPYGESSAITKGTQNIAPIYYNSIVNYAYLPFNTTLTGGEVIKLTGYFSAYGPDSVNRYIKVYVPYNNELLEVSSVLVRNNSSYTNFVNTNLSIELPVSTNGLVFGINDLTSGNTFLLGDIQVSYSINNLQSLIDNAFSSGSSSGYSEGYISGKADGIIIGSQRADYSFREMLGAVVDTPVQAFMQIFDFEVWGINISSFIAVLFTLCIVLIILKFALGRS